MPAKNSLPSLRNGNIIIYGCIVGSHAYGTNVEGSDEDRKWVYVQSYKDFFINGYRPQIEISKDEVIYELSRFLELLQKANPTILELLFSPKECIIYKHQVFDMIISMRKQFLTKVCRHSFGGYAISQIEKAKGLNKKMNWEKEMTERKDVLDFCYWIDDTIDPHSGVKYKSRCVKECWEASQLRMMGLAAIPHTRDLYNLFWDARYSFKGVVQNIETSNDISLSDVPKDANCIGMLYFNKDGYTQHCKAYREYQEWLQHRNTQRYIDIENHGQKIDGKNMLHCVRLIETALDIAEFGELIVKRSNAEFLKEIRHGKHNLDALLEYAQNKIKSIDKAFEESNLPDKFTNESLLKYINYFIRETMSDKKSTETQESTNY